tara:strand:+ start:247 stop:1305 length:1059 start_codon:yes stop_codon:yes gene_type:complete
MSSWLNLKKFDGEITNRCNAACVLCARTGIHNGVSDIIKSMGLRDVKVEDYKEILTSKNGKNIVTINYCGNYGDPMMHPKAFEIFKQNHDLGVTKQRPDTNGGMRDKNWWSELGKIKSMRVQFAIDGLADTNHIYRRNTDYEKIIENAKAYIDSGGAATWVMLVFEHNQHQVEDARELAKKMGFVDFAIKRTARGYNPDKPEHLEIQPYRKRNDQDIIKDKIKFTSIKKYQPDIMHKGRQEYEVVPKCLSWKQMFITSDRLIIPCCHIQPGLFWHLGGKYAEKSRPFSLYLEENKIKYDLEKYAFDEIMESYEEFYPGFEKRWKEKSFPICNKQCGSNFVNEVMMDNRDKYL